MLLSFRLANFRSFRDEQEFSFVRGSYTAPDQSTSADAPRPWDPRVGTLAGLYGANASGKSNVLKALKFMRDAVRDSFQNWAPDSSIPVEPFRLDPAYENAPSLFEVTFVINKTRYQYGFRLTRRQVVGEWLYAYPTSRRQIWFERDISTPEVYYFGKNFGGRNRVIQDLTRPNSLFLSTAIANNHKRADIVAHWFRMHLTSASPEDQSARVQYTASMSNRDERWGQITELMQFADLGICRARVRKEEVAEIEREKLRRVFRAVDVDTSSQHVEDAIDRSSRIIEFGHSTGDSKDPIYLPITAESLGTQVWFSLVGPVLRAVNNGDTLMVDELDASLHPQLTSEVLKIFREPSKNPKQAQLIFTSHDTALLGNLLDEKELVRDQVWFTEKKRDGSSVLYPLTDFAPRTSENLERGYLQGRYGAIPFLDEELLGDILEQSEPVEQHGSANNQSLHGELPEGDVL